MSECAEARIRGLFLKHKKTGNPLASYCHPLFASFQVDSVAEHSATSNQAYESTPRRLFEAVALGNSWATRASQP